MTKALRWRSQRCPHCGERIEWRYDLDIRFRRRKEDAWPCPECFGKTRHTPGCPRVTVPRERRRRREEGVGGERQMGASAGGGLHDR